MALDGTGDIDASGDCVRGDFSGGAGVVDLVVSLGAGAGWQDGGDRLLSRGGWDVDANSLPLVRR